LPVRPGPDPAPLRRTRGIAIALIAVLAAGCATTQTRWYLNGRTDAEFQAHGAQCAAQASQAMSGQNLNTAGQFMGSGGQVAGLGLLMAAFEVGGLSARQSACMRDLGYTKAP